MKYYFYYLYYKTLFYKDYLFGNINYRQLNKKISEIDLYICSSMYPIEISLTKTPKKIVDIEGEEEEEWLDVSDEDCTTACIDKRNRLQTKTQIVQDNIKNGVGDKEDRSQTVLVEGLFVTNIVIPNNLTISEAIGFVKNHPDVKRELQGKRIIKEIFVEEGKFINILTK